jgi:hypothetical protein
MGDLLQLAAAVLVELAVARQDVQFFQQLDRLSRAQHIGQRVGKTHLWRRRGSVVGALHGALTGCGVSRLVGVNGVCFRVRTGFFMAGIKRWEGQGYQTPRQD